MESDEYLEKIVAASYAREIEQEENVFRTLPFAAAALAIIFSFIVLIKSDVPGQVDGVYPIVIWVMLSLFWIVIAVSLCFLWLAIAARPLQYLSRPDELYQYVAELRNYYTALGIPVAQVGQHIIADLRTLMIEQYALGAVHNQRINERRLRARTRSFQTLVVALVLAVATVVIIMGHKLARGGSSGTTPIEQRAQS